jgi:hypothetical protein
MKLTVHVTLSDDDDTETVVREVFALTREAWTPDTLGLGLAETKDLLTAVQDTLVSATVAAQDTCPDCATPYRHKDKHTIVVRSLFGTLRLDGTVQTSYTTLDPHPIDSSPSGRFKIHQSSTY